MLSEVQNRLERAKDAYTHALTQIDRMLKPIIASNPEMLDDAKTFQQSFLAIDYTPIPLDEATQPDDDATHVAGGTEPAHRGAPDSPTPPAGARSDKHDRAGRKGGGH